MDKVHDILVCREDEEKCVVSAYHYIKVPSKSGLQYGAIKQLVIREEKDQKSANCKL